MIVAVHQPQYIPWLGYFNKIASCDKFVFLDNVQYKHREFQNRNRIRTAKGWIWLTVPVVMAQGSRINISEVLIDNESPWQRKHLGSLRSSYSAAPYFDKYYSFFEDTLNKKWDKLIDLNVFITRYLLKALNINTSISCESELNISTARTERIIDICKALKADTYLSGTGAKDYLDESLFSDCGIDLKYQEFHHPQYRQCFQPFEPYMSVIDLLFNEGPDSGDKLRNP